MKKIFVKSIIIVIVVLYLYPFFKPYQVVYLERRGKRISFLIDPDSRESEMMKIQNEEGAFWIDQKQYSSED